MSKRGEIDPFLCDPRAPIFVEAAFEAHDTTGNWRIPDNIRRAIQAGLSVSDSQVAAFAYLGERRAEDEMDSFELDLLNFPRNLT